MLKMKLLSGYDEKKLENDFNEFSKEHDIEQVTFLLDTPARHLFILYREKTKKTVGDIRHELED